MMTLPILIKREFWEHRSAFLVLPTIITLFFVMMMLFVFTVSTTDMIDMTIDLDDDSKDMIHDRASTDDLVSYLVHELDGMGELRRESSVNRGLQSLSIPLVFVLWGVIFFYLLSALYDDRHDRSILFWKSLPVSDAMTVISKLVTGLIVVPLVYLAGIATLQLSALIFLTLGTIGTDISAWEIVWGPASIFGNWFNYIAAVLFYSLWALPFFGWLLAVSSFAKSVPLAWALGVPFGLMITERIFTNQSAVADWMGNHVIPVRFLSEENFSLGDLPYQIFSLQMLSALVVGGALVFAAIWLRGKADEI